MGLREYVGVLRRRWLSIVVFTVLGIAVAAGLTFTAPKSYTATAQNFVALAGASADASALSGAQFAAQRVKSYTEIVGGPDVLQPVMQELGITSSVAALGSAITVSNPPGTVLLLVSVSNGSAQQAATIANAVSVQLGRVIEKLETPSSASNSPVKVTLTEPAVPPTIPSSPIVRSNLAIGLMIGLALGLGWAFLRDGLDNTIKSVPELDKLSTSPTLGTVLFDTNAKHQVLTAIDSKSIQSEGYRTIRTNLQFVNVDDPVRAFVVTSAAPGDGKTTVACNLAIALAQSGKSVCLVESDLRRPKVTDYLGITAGSGLTEVLAGQAKLEDALHSWGGGLFNVLPPGALPPNPSELLGSHQMGHAISRLKEKFDVVILDTPPLLAVSDAAVLASQADGAVIVVRHGQTTRDAFRHAHGTLSQINARVMGTVLNAVPAKRGYGYGYGYGKNTKRKHAKTVNLVESSPGGIGTSA